MDDTYTTEMEQDLADERELLEERKARYAELDDRQERALARNDMAEVQRLDQLLDRQERRIRESRNAIRTIKGSLLAARR